MRFVFAAALVGAILSLSALYLPLGQLLRRFPFKTTIDHTINRNMTTSGRIQTREAWLAALDALPSNPKRIPAFFFAHGSPMLAFSESAIKATGHPLAQYGGPTGPNAQFLRDFGPVLMKKYNPKGIVVFSAHWETHDERLVSDYGSSNPLLYDYYGFPPELYELKFESKGDSALAQHIVDLYKEAGQRARLTNRLESRGEDGRGFSGPGLDHGVFVPFRLMFGEKVEDVPVVQVSIDSSLSPEKNWQLGKAVSQLRDEGYLILSGGLTIHNLRDASSFTPAGARSVHKEFDDALHEAIGQQDPTARKKALVSLPHHPGFRACHPREEHFVPIYVAAGAGEDGDVRALAGMYGTPTFAFGV